MPNDGSGNTPPLPHYYYNTSLHVSQWEHPSLTHWRSVLCELQAFERQSLSRYDAAHHTAMGTMATKSDGTGLEPPRPMLWVTSDPGQVPGSG